MPTGGQWTAARRAEGLPLPEETSHFAAARVGHEHPRRTTSFRALAYAVFFGWDVERLARSVVSAKGAALAPISPIAYRVPPGRPGWVTVDTTPSMGGRLRCRAQRRPADNGPRDGGMGIATVTNVGCLL